MNKIATNGLAKVRFNALFSFCYAHVTGGLVTINFEL